jgi:hypothetical protein
MVRKRLVLERGGDVVVVEGARVSIERVLVRLRGLHAAVAVCVGAMAIARVVAGPGAVVLAAVMCSPLLVVWISGLRNPSAPPVTRPLVAFDFRLGVVYLGSVVPTARIDEVELVAVADATHDGFEIRSPEGSLPVLVDAPDRPSLARAGVELQALGVPVTGIPDVQGPYRRGA